VFREGGFREGGVEKEFRKGFRKGFREEFRERGFRKKSLGEGFR